VLVPLPDCRGGRAGELHPAGVGQLLVTFAQVPLVNGALLPHQGPRCVRSVHPNGARNDRAGRFPKDETQSAAVRMQDRSWPAAPPETSFAAPTSISSPLAMASLCARKVCKPAARAFVISPATERTIPTATDRARRAVVSGPRAGRLADSRARRQVAAVAAGSASVDAAASDSRPSRRRPRAATRPGRR
jgi:hypothetical protein